MKSRTLILIAAVFVFAFPTVTLGKSEVPRLLYIFATGPELYDPNGKSRHERWEKQADSSYAKKVVDGLIERVHHNYPNAQTFHLRTFTKNGLEKIYQEAALADVDRILLIVVAHGAVRDSVFYIWTDSGMLFEDELLGIIKDTPTDVALFTCNSGAVQTDEFPGYVFGASLKHTAMDAVHFYGWASFLGANPQLGFPISAQEIHQSWLDYRIHDKVERAAAGLAYKARRKLELSDELMQMCWGGSHPFFIALGRRAATAVGQVVKR